MTGSCSMQRARRGGCGLTPLAGATMGSTVVDLTPQSWNSLRSRGHHSAGGVMYLITAYREFVGVAALEPPLWFLCVCVRTCVCVCVCVRVTVRACASLSLSLCVIS